MIKNKKLVWFEMKDKMVVFGGENIRRVWRSKNRDDSGKPDGEWYFSVVDVVGVLSGSSISRRYLGKIKAREFVEMKLSPAWVQLKK